MTKRTGFWVALVAGLLLLSLAGCFLVLRRHSGEGGSAVATVYLDGAFLRSIELNEVDEPYSFTVEGPIGRNTVSVEPGRIRVSCADCPDQICVEQGWVSDGALPIVCLPNRLVIQVEASGESAGIDGVTG